MITSDGNSNTSNKGLICKPSELPIYSPDIPIPKCIEEKPTWFSNFLQQKVSGFRSLVDNVVHEAKAYENVAEEYIKDGIDKADGALTYLRQENSTAPKIGAIAIGGLTGLILSLRKGYFKRTLYTTAGATVMTAICYPKQTAEYSQIGVREGKKYATIAYNFAYGDKADSDNKCTYKADYGNEEDNDEEVVCHCFDNFDSMEVEDPCPYL